MKTKLILFLLLLSTNIAHAQIIYDYSTKGSGEWSQDLVWDPGSPGYSLIADTYKVGANHEVFANGNIDIPKTKNVGWLDIFGKFTLNGDFIVYANKWNINVAPGAEFIITGNIELIQPAQGFANPILDITGVVIVKGDLKGTGDVTGDGLLYVDGDVGEKIEVELFTGIVADGLTDHTLLPPHSFGGIFSDDPYGIHLSWQFNADEVSAELTHLGFQIFRDNLPGSHPDTYILFNLLNGNLTVDANSRMFFDKGPFQSDEAPRYYIRAIYSRNDSIFYSPVVRYNHPTPPPSFLPVSLLFLEANPAAQAIEIAWATASETNNMGFEVQRLKGEQWEPIGFVDGQYNSNAVFHYSFTDNNPLNGINYYRLKQMDYDGKFEYLGPVAAKSIVEDADFNIRVVNSPNNLYLMLPGTDTGRMEIFDITGKAIQNSVASGRVDLSLAPGTYIVRYIVGDRITTSKFRF